MSVSSDQTTRLHAPWKQHGGQVSSRYCSAIVVTYSTMGSASVLFFVLFFFVLFCFFPPKNLGFLGKIELRTSGQSVYAVHEAVELRCMKYLEFYL